MKIKIIVPLIVIATVFVFRLSIEKQKIDSYEIVYEKIEQNTHDVYYYENNKLVFVTVSFDGVIEVNELFDLLTNKSNSIKEEYDTKLTTSTILLDYEINDLEIILNVSSDFLRINESDCYEIFVQLKNTFSNLGFNKLSIKVENELISKIGYIDISAGILLSNV